MKFLLAFSFALILPIVLFLTTVLYGGISNNVLKASLAESDIYQKLGSYISDVESDEEQNDTSELQGMIMAFLTPEYARQKTEEVIDAGYLWITDSSTGSPSVSFPEIKDQVQRQNPQLLSELTAMSEEIKSQPHPEGISGEDLESFEQMGNSADMLTTFVKNDFSIPLETHLRGMKQFYHLLKILQPVLLVVLLLCLILLWVLNKTISSRLQWIGAALMLSAIFGFITIALQTTLLSLLISVTTQESNELSMLFLPIAAEIMRDFVKTYTNYQGIASVVLLIISALCFVIASLNKNQKPAIKPVPVKKQKK
jgi:hypothetical protein